MTALAETLRQFIRVELRFITRGFSLAAPPGPLGLHLPELSTSLYTGVFASPEGLQLWLESLPMANVGECARQVYTALYDANRASLAAQMRLRELEAMRPTIHFLISALERHYTGQAFPLPERSYQVAELSRQLLAEMAAGYKRALEDLLANRDAKIIPKQLVLAVQRAMYYLSRALLTSHQIYAAPFDYTWLELHHLYFFAEQNQFQDTAVDDPPPELHDACTIEITYKAVLLFALANPYRLVQRDIAEVYVLAMRSALQSRLLPYQGGDNLAGRFVVDLDLDNGPGVHREGDLHTHRMRALDTAGLIAAIKEAGIPTTPQKSWWGGGKTIKDPREELGRRLVTLWGAIPKRMFSRMGHNHHARLVLGLNTLFELLHDDHATTIHFASAATFRLPEIPRDLTKEPDIWAIAEGAIVDTPKVESPPEPVAAPPATATPYDCYITNVSEGGCRVVWKKGTLSSASIGMLVGLERKMDDAPPTWHIGVVRWMMTVARNDLVLGVEFLSTRAEAVAIRLIEGRARGGGYIRALCISNNQSHHGEPTLITPPYLHSGDQVMIVRGNGEERAHLTRQVEVSGAFSQFEFMTKTRSASATPSTGLAPGAHQFDNLWSSLN